MQVDHLGQAQAVAPADADYRPTDPQIAWHLGRFIEQVRSIPADPIIVRQNWLRAYEWTTDRGASALNDYARTNDPFTKVGKQQIAVDVSSVIRASPDSFRVAWTERHYENGQLSATERWAELLTNHVPKGVTARHYLETSRLQYLQPEAQQVGDWIDEQAAKASGANVIPFPAAAK